MDNIVIYRLFRELQDFVEDTWGRDSINSVELRPLDDKVFPGQIEMAAIAGDTTHKIKATYSCESKGDADV